ncbi:uncharacterized protein LOC110724104 [Chenopodium quinoa]|uniref:uncharacterized protein LOC110724104 n=1 Tax=Chenopodium quinoa TaxID=63459 RepID=UPI000B790C3F|nr:uncharacterized protein LOC110724104 [Chenopodium quinoa]
MDELIQQDHLMEDEFIEQQINQEEYQGSSDSDHEQEQYHEGNDADGYDADDDANQEELQQNCRPTREMTVEQKRAIVEEIMLHMEGDSLPRGFLANLARKYSVHKSTTTRWFQVIKHSLAQGIVVDVNTKKLGRTGRKAKQYTDEFMTSVPLYKRTTERGYAGALKIPKTALHRLRQQGRLRTHTSTNHRALTEKHKVARLKWVLSLINHVPAIGDPTFSDMQQWIHLDEKWFYINPETRTFTYFQQKMIHTRLNNQGGLFPFVKYERAKKKSKNRDAGTLETKAIQSVTKECIREMLLTHVIPTIYEKWPQQLPKDIIIQWDNARPHQVPKDEEFQAACHAHGFNIQFIFQPSQSPETNVLDLGLFSVIQSLQYQSFPRNLDDLIKEVARAFQEFDPILNKYTWITLQSCLIKILEKQGGNNFSPPHTKKRSLDSQGLLPQLLEVDRDLIGQVVHFLDTVTITGDDEGNMEVDAD